MAGNAVFNVIAITTLIVMGVIFILQGFYLLHLQRTAQMPKKAHALGVSSVSIGVMSFGFAVLYAFIG